MQKNLQEAKNAKNDEFYTQYDYIQREINAYLEFDQDAFRGKTVLLPCNDLEHSNFTGFFAQNFEYFGLKKLISTSYAKNSNKQFTFQFYASELEKNSPKYDPAKTDTNGKIFILDRAANGTHRLDIHDLKWDYLQGDGDFRSPEVKALRDEADIIITNPPFSLFREFLSWIIEADKKFLIIGNINCITYKEVFPLIKDNKIWLGASGSNRDVVFEVPEDYEVSPSDRAKAEKLGYFGNYTTQRNTCWFTNLDHGRRHEPLILMNMADNMKFNKTIVKQGKKYFKYDNYDAIDVPVTQAIPSDYDGVMGVPVSFLDKYCPEQFEILGLTSGRNEFDKEAWPTKRYENALQHNSDGTTASGSKANTRATILLEDEPTGVYYTADNADGPFQIMYARILIRWKQPPEQRI
ncbi:MAG: hypothetical protein IJ667_08510 [Synergistaceae bacterium]|nr:hypothetical protein [Synergistaceae bacterium]